LILVNDKAIGGEENRTRDSGEKTGMSFQVVIRKTIRGEIQWRFKQIPSITNKPAQQRRGPLTRVRLGFHGCSPCWAHWQAPLFFAVYRWYQHKYSFSVGMDSFEPEFQLYWMRLFYIQMSLITLAGAIGVPLLWFTRPADPMAMPARTELRVYYTILAFAAIGSVLVVSILGLYVEADAAWHQITIRDTDFTPTHIGLFYFAIPSPWWRWFSGSSGSIPACPTLSSGFPFPWP